jgi:mannose-6-phosphate isomerase-like protein (cupin superfamily)
MRLRVLCTILTLLMTAAIARQLTAQNPPPPPKLFASAADVTAMIAKAKAERKPDQPNFIQPIVGLAPYTANLEHRVAGIPAPASVHEREAEMFYVVEGSGTLVTGGSLENPTATDLTRLNAGPSQTGVHKDGDSRKVGPKDVIIVPAGMPHRFSELDGPIVYLVYRFEPKP